MASLLLAVLNGTFKDPWAVNENTFKCERGAHW